MMGPGELSFTPTAASSITGEDRTMSTSEPAISMARFTKALPRLSRGMRRRLIRGRPFRLSNWGWGGMYLA